MGNIQHCLQFKEEYYTDELRSSKIVSSVPSAQYAIRIKKFPELLQILKQSLSKHRIKEIDTMIKDTPVYFIHNKSTIYQGHWKKGLPNGYAKILYPDFSYYQGRLIEGQLDTGQNDQQGLYIFKDGSTYKGNFKQSKFQGKGKLTSNQVTIYGQFKDGLPHGKVVQQIVSESRLKYQGQFFKGLKHGYGQYKQNNQTVYQGYFQNGNYHGQGVLIQDDGNQYSGEFSQGRKINGQYKSKARNFMATIRNQQFNGLGFYQWKDGKFYIGQFKNNKFQGNAKLYYPNGQVVVGQWQNGHNKIVKQIQTLQQAQILEAKKKYLEQMDKKQLGQNQQQLARNDQQQTIHQSHAVKTQSHLA